MRTIHPLVAAAVGLLLLAGCDIFEVNNPETLSSEDLTNVNTLANTTEGVLAMSYGDALLGGELVGDGVFHTASFDFAFPLERGLTPPPDNDFTSEIYNQVVRVPWIADEMISRLQDTLSNPSASPAVANSHYFAGIATLTLAQMYQEVTLKKSAPISPGEAIRRAIDRFETTAEIAGAAGETNLRAGAYASIARSYRALYWESVHHGGEDPSLVQEAESFARQALSTKSDFSVHIDYEQPADCNPMYDDLVQDRGYRMGVDYAFITDPVSGERDPRVQHSELETYSSRGDPQYLQQKFASCNVDLPVSHATEARLIIAEGRLVADDVEGAVSWINQVRSAAGLPAFSSTDSAEVRNQLIYERKVELWLEGRRWPDHRYYEIFPDKWVPAAKEAGVHRRWPISEQEMNANPNYPG